MFLNFAVFFFVLFFPPQLLPCLRLREVQPDTGRSTIEVIVARTRLKNDDWQNI